MLEQRVEKLERDSDLFKKGVANDIYRIDQRLNRLEAGQQRLEAEVGTLKLDMSAVKSDVATLKLDMSEIQSDIKAILEHFKIAS